MERRGGSLVQSLREQVSEATLAYYARLGELKQGIDIEKPVVKPPALTLHEQLQAFPGTLPWAGGMLDQPYLLMVELSGVNDAEFQRQLAKLATDSLQKAQTP